MKKGIACLLVLVFLGAIQLGGYMHTASAAEVETDRVIVKLKPSAKAYSLKKYSKKEKTIDTKGFMKTLSVPKQLSALEFARKLEEDSHIEYAELDKRFKLMARPKDPYYTKQWFHKKIQSETAWNKTKGSKNIIVAVIDNGIDLSQPDLKGKIYAPYDIVHFNDTYIPIGDHGTHVSGIIAGAMNNQAGGTGVAPNTRIMPINVFDGEYSYYSDVIYAVYYAVQMKADIINLSLGSYGYSESVNEVIQDAHKAGLVIVAAAGNENTNWSSYPASYKNVISVSATTQKDRISGYSNYGKNIDLAAPGDEILSTFPYKSFGYMSGTSMAAPIVSGVAALVWGNKPSLTNIQVEQRLFSTADDLGKKGRDDLYGYGRINANQAVHFIAMPTVNQVKDTTKTITGKAEKGSTVTVKKGSAQLGKGAVNGKGQYKINIKNKQKAGTRLSITAKSKAGYMSKARTVTVIKSR